MENGYKVSSFQANSDAEMALVMRRVDAWVIDDLTAAEMVKAYNKDHPDALTIPGRVHDHRALHIRLCLQARTLVEKISEIQAGARSKVNFTIAGPVRKVRRTYTSPISE